MRSKRTQKPSSIGTGKSAPNGTKTRDQTTLLLDAEAARRDAERKYRDIFENAVEGIFQTSPEGGFITANPALARMLGFETPEELIRARDLEGTYYVHPERRVEFKRLLDQHDTVRGFEFEAYRKDRSKVWMSDNVRAVRDESGTLVYYEGITEDITERKRAEAALRESEERYRDLVENTHELICTHDLDGLILSANPAASAAVGYDLDEQVGKKTIRDLLAPEVKDQFDEYMAKLRKDGTTSGIMLVQTKSGERRVWEYYNSLRTEGVATPIVRGMARDITEQRRAEKAMSDLGQELELTMNSMQEGIHRVDLQGKIVFENAAAAHMLGWEVSELLGKRGHPTMHHTRPDGTPYPEEECPIYATFRDGISRHVPDEVFWRQDGTSFPVEYMSAPMRNDRGEIFATVVTFRDITERKRAQQALLTYSRRLLEAQEAERGRIARELHDQIGQMLTALKLNLHAIQSARSGNEAWRLIEDNLKMLDEALEQVRDLSVDLRPLLLDDLGLVTALRWYVDRQARRTGVVAEFTSDSLDPDLRFSAELETACFRIAQEALTNVARHANAKLVTVRLSRDEQHLHLSIEDDGVGFDSESPRGHAVGATLGLRGMDERAKALGGRVRIESTRNNGTRVFVELPITIPNEAKPRTQTARK
jgi:PAS domain S-box-containing protein